MPPPGPTASGLETEKGPSAGEQSWLQKQHQGTSVLSKDASPSDGHAESDTEDIDDDATNEFFEKELDRELDLMHKQLGFQVNACLRAYWKTT